MRIVKLPLAILALAAIAACGGGKSSSTGGSSAGSNGGSSAGSRAGSGAGSSMGSEAAPAMGNMPNCGAVAPVWVNLQTRKYHEQSDPAYGHTKQGEYLCPSAAVSQGFTRAGAGHGRHHKRHYQGGSQSAGYQSGGSQSNDDNQDSNSDATSNP